MDDVLDKFEDLSLAAGQSKSTDGDAPTLDNLATELKVTILMNMPDIPSLKSLVQSSPGYYDVFVSRRHEILSSVAGLVDIQPEVLVDALAVRDASLRVSSRGYGAAYMAEAEDYVHQYQVSRQNLAPAFRYADAEDVNPLHSIVCDLTRHFASRVLSKHPVTAEQMVGVADLSKEETRRLHRAFYRVELFEKIFPPRPVWLVQLESASSPEEVRANSSHLSILDVSKWYFGMFEAYEVEEMACIYEYMRDTYAEVLRALAVELEISRQELVFDMVVTGFTTLGLRFFQKVIRASSVAELLELLRPNVPTAYPEFHPFFHALKEESPHELNHTDKFKANNGSELLFTNDDATGPNAAWVWSTGGSYEFNYFLAEKASMRSWGYVFWDKKRLDGWGVLEVDPMEFMKVSVGEAFMEHHDRGFYTHSSAWN